MDADFKSEVAFTRKAYSPSEVLAPKTSDERAEPLRAILAEAGNAWKPDRLVVDEQGRTPSRQRIYRAFIALQTPARHPADVRFISL